MSDLPEVKPEVPVKKQVRKVAAPAEKKASAPVADRKAQKVVKPESKPEAKPKPKPKPKATPKTLPKPKVPVKAPVKVATKPAVKPPRPVAVVAEPVKAAKVKPKLVRDSFTMPSVDFALIDQLKDRAMAFKRPAKKSELLRAGLQALVNLSDAKLKALLDGLMPLKAGRPKKATDAPQA